MKHLILALLLLVLASAWANPALAADSAPAQLNAIAIAFQGPVEAIGPARWLVAGRTVSIRPDTVLVERDGPSAPGMWAKVDALWCEACVLEAVRIETAQQTAGPASTARFSGSIDEIGDGYWIVGDRRILVDENTAIHGEPAVGFLALIEASEIASAWVANSIVVIPVTGVDPLFMEGQLRTVSASIWQVQVGSAIYDLQISPETMVRGAPVVGYWAEAVVALQPDQSYRALFIEVLDPGQTTTCLSGRLILQITATAPEQWIVLAPAPANEQWQTRTLLVDRSTTVIDERQGPATPGAWVEARVLQSAEPGAPWPVRTLRTVIGPFRRVEGVIDALGAGSLPATWQVGGHTVIVNRDTRFDGRPRVGRYAIVDGLALPGGETWATLVRIRYRFQGHVVARRDAQIPRMWVIETLADAGGSGAQAAKVFLALDENTQVDEDVENGNIGMLVDVQARMTPSGWLAEKILALTDPL